MSSASKLNGSVDEGLQAWRCRPEGQLKGMQRRALKTSRKERVPNMAGLRPDIGRRRRENGAIEVDLESRGASSNGGDAKTKSNRSTDLRSIILLLVLYTLQGIPMGLSASIPFLLLEKVTYSEQALFSLVSLPFSLKLLWAPLVDSVYSASFGRRKSWLVPAQLLCGVMMLWARGTMDEWMGEDGGKPHIKTLTAYFLALYAIMATQDIAVDGWALTMLSNDNVGHASTCNTIGQKIASFISQIGFLALNDPAVCNKYFRSKPSDVGIVTLSSFLQFWGVVFLVTTFFVWFFKPEVENGVNDKGIGIVETYKQVKKRIGDGKTPLLKCMRLPAVQSLVLVLLTCRIAFAVTEAASSLKLVEYGMPKEEIALLSPILVTLGMIIPIAVGRMTAGPRPMSVFMWGYPIRIAVTLMYLRVLPMAREAHMVPGVGSTKFFSWLISAMVLREVASNCMFVSQMALFSRVSDPVIGGSYMTLLNTIANVGSRWPASLSLSLLDRLTFSRCIDVSGNVIAEASCSSEEGKNACLDTEGNSCVVWLDGYNVQSVLCIILGIAWLGVFTRRVLRIQDLPSQAWVVWSGRKNRGDV